MCRLESTHTSGCAVTGDLPDNLNPAPHPARPAVPLREIDSRALMQGNREIVIRHGEETYRLSVTRSGKLILRK